MGIFDRFRKARPASLPAPATEPVGVGGTVAYGGYLHSREKSADLQFVARWRTFMEMVLNVGIIGTGVRRRSALLGGVKWRWQPGNDSAQAKELAAFVERQVADLKTPWPTVVKRAGMFEFFGHQIQEWTAKRIAEGIDAGKFGLEDIALRPVETIERWIPDGVGGWAGVVQRDPENGRELDPIPRWKMLHVVDGLLTDSPEGSGLLRHAADLVRQLKRYRQLEGWGFETDLGGVPIGRAPRSEMAAMPDKGASLEAGLKSFISNPIKRPDLGLVLDSATLKDANGNPTTIPKWGIELLKTGASSHKEVGEAVHRLIWEIALLMGCEHLLLGYSGGGSLAMQSQKSRDFYLLVMGTLEQIAIAMRRDVLTPIWKLNRWDQALMPFPVYDRLAFQDVDSIMKGLSELATGGLMHDWSYPYIAELFDSWGITPPPPDVLERAMAEAREAAASKAGLDKPGNPDKDDAEDGESVDVDLEDDEED